MKILFCGDRNWENIEYILRIMKTLKEKFGEFTVIEGEAKGADSIARECAVELGLPVEKYLADWNNFHRAAGPIRNKQMLDEGKPNGVVAFHPNIELSKGTKNMVCLARKANIPVWLSQYTTIDIFIEELSNECKRSVLNIYPNAFVSTNACDDYLDYQIVTRGENTITAWVNILGWGYSHSEAWADAWNRIQLEMLEKLLQ